MIHDFATLPKEPIDLQPPRSAQAAVRFRRRPGVKLALILLVLVVVLVKLVQDPEAPVEFSPGIAESIDYQQATEGGAAFTSSDELPSVVSDKSEAIAERRVFEASLSQSLDSAEGYGFYDSLQSSNWRVPVQKGVYFTEEDRKRSSYRYVLQAASMRDRAEAVSLVKKLKALKMPASYSESTSGYGQTWYRVNVGPFNNNSIMNKAEDRLVSMRMMPLKRRVD